MSMHCSSELTWKFHKGKMDGHWCQFPRALVSYNSCDNKKARVVVTAAIRPPKRGEWLGPAKTIPNTQELLLLICQEISRLPLYKHRGPNLHV